MKEQQQQAVLLDFLNKYKDHISKKVNKKDIASVKARILKEDQLKEAAELIVNGHLVAFPTQTVYGLGANALNAEALKNIYLTKKRPLSDPIIVHVLDHTQAEQLVQVNPQQQKLFHLLTDHFWPGPLTVILKANLSVLPAIVTAQTGFVGIRAPKHPFARKFLETCKVPIGAPSANLFSHVSPTEPVHVFNDFFDCDVTIIDGDRCQFGVQSTVVKLLEGEIQVLREGSLSMAKLSAFLKEFVSEEQRPQLVAHRKVIGHNINMEAPGQSLKHYAPDVPCFFFSGPKPTPQLHSKTTVITSSESAFISFDKERYSPFRDLFKHYFQVGQNLPETLEAEKEEEELFCSKQQQKMMREIYYLLRECENREVGAVVVGWSGEKEGTMWDKVMRATQGEQVECSL